MAQSRRFCPNCGSNRVEPDTSNRAEQFFSGGNPNRWACKECSYTGMMPTEETETTEKSNEKEKIEFEPKEEYSREYTGFGPAYVKYLLYVTLPVLAFYYLYLRLG